MIVITGGAGFIGSNLVAALEERGLERLVVCDVLGDDDKWRNIAKRDIYDYVHPDNLISFLDSNKNIVQAIFHMGAISSTTETDVDWIIKNNVTLSTQLLHWCGRHRVRLIYASSAATYGDGRAGYKDGFTREELSYLRPMNPYGWSKHAFDRIVAQTLALKDTPMPPQWAGLKFFNVYGPNEYHKGGQMSLVPQIFKQITENGVARLFRSDRPNYPDGGQMRDFVYVRDCIDVMLWLYDNSSISGLFNVGTGVARSFLDLATTVFKAMEQEESIEFFDMPETLQGQYQYFTQADMTKLRAVGYSKPFTPLEGGIQDYVKHFLLQEDRYR